MARWRSGVPVVLSLLGLAIGPGAILTEAQDDPVYDRVMREKKLRVHFVQAPPQQWRAPDGEAKGFDVDIYRYVCKRLGVELEVVWTSAAGMIPTLTSGRSDMGAAMYRTPEREKVVDFTIPVKWVGDHVIVHLDNKDITSLETLRGKVLAAVRGSAHEVAAREIQQAGYAKEVRAHESVDPMFQDLNAKRVDAVVYTTMYFQWYASQNPTLKARLAFEIDHTLFGRPVRSPSQFPVSKGATKLTEAVNQIILEMRENGQLARIYQNYGITEPSVWTAPK